MPPRGPVILFALILGACGGDGGGDGSSETTASATTDLTTATDSGTDGGSSGGTDTGIPEGPCGTSLEILAPVAGDIYLDGYYTGETSPGALLLTPGSHRVGLGTPDGTYLLRTVEVEESAEHCGIMFQESERLGPRIWKALYVDIPSIHGVETDCQVDATQAELDATYDFFELTMVEFLRLDTFGVMEWDVTRVSTSGTIDIDGGPDEYTLDPADLGAVFADLAPGDYDAIFTGWKAQGADCSLDASYVGLGWTPQPDTKQMGFANLRLHSADVVAHVANLINDDPGGFIHEWLHTVEFHYEDHGSSMPLPEGGFPLHAAENYGYIAPWLIWYEDFMRGKVFEPIDPGYRGIRPEQLHDCTPRDVALDPAACD